MANTCGNCAHWRKPADRTGYQDPFDGIDFHGTPLDYPENPAPYWDPETGRMAYPHADDPKYAERHEYREKVMMSYGECDGIEIQRHRVGQALPLATLMDASQYFPTLFTRPEFSCAMYKPREA